jgi:hypothetical protein
VISALVGPLADLLEALGGLAVPALAVGLPVVLLVAILVAQLLAGAAWLPFVRRFLGGFGFRQPAALMSPSAEPPNPSEAP